MRHAEGGGLETVGMPRQLDTEHEEGIRRTLGVDSWELTPLGGGTNERTFAAKTEKGEFVVRLEGVGGLQLKRAYNAQQRAARLGVSVPRMIAHNFDDAQAELWTIEDKVEGRPFYPDQMGEDEARATAVDLGRQLRAVNSATCDRFGLLPPYPYDSYGAWERVAPEETRKSENLTGPVFDSFRTQMEFKKGKIGTALELLGVERKRLSEIEEIYAALTYGETPKFCGGDTATSNILVANGKVTALIDWEWAHGGDPAENVAAWSYWNRDQRHLENFLEGYAPENLADFRRRVLLHEVAGAINLAHVYSGMKDVAGLRQTKETLERKLANQLWK
jgi:aminoglycoside phosphotransferase (APT) family kinase protein